GNVLALIDHVPGEPHEVLRHSAGLGQHLHDVAQRLLDLGHKIIAGELLVGVPSDLTGHEHLSALGGDTVGKAFGGAPVLVVKTPHGCTYSCLCAPAPPPAPPGARASAGGISRRSRGGAWGILGGGPWAVGTRCHS